MHQDIQFRLDGYKQNIPSISFLNNTFNLNTHLLDGTNAILQYPQN